MMFQANLVYAGRAIRVNHSPQEVRDMIVEANHGVNYREITVETDDGPVTIEAGAIEAVNP